MKFQTIVLNKKKVKNFARARNTLLKNAKQEWVLFVDTDETVSEKLKKEIIGQNSNGYNGFFLKRKNYFLGQFVGTEKLLRLGKKDSGRWSRIVHETWQISGKKKILKNYLIHNTADNLSEYLFKINYYSTLHAIANRKEGKVSGVFKIFIFPLCKFIQTFLKSKNVVFSIMSSLHSFLSWSKLYLIQNKK